MKFEEKIRKFMYGRYGPDELYKFLFELYIRSIFDVSYKPASTRSFVNILLIFLSVLITKS